MPEIKFNYEKACACIPAGITVSDKRYSTLINSSIQGSLSASQTPQFLAQFRDKPDTIETQVDMYAALLDDVCVRLGRGIQTLETRGSETENEKVQETISGLTSMIRGTYAIMACCEVVSFEDSIARTFQRVAVAYTKDPKVAERFPYDETPLLAAYLQEKLGDANPTSEAIQQAINDFLVKLKAKDFLDGQGTTAQLVANLEAVLL